MAKLLCATYAGVTSLRVRMQQMILDEKKIAVDTILNTCLGCLVDLGFVSKESFEGKEIYSRYDMSERLASLQFFAAASIDDIGRPVLVFNIEHNIKVLAWAIAHEAVHLAQVCKGEWEPFQGYSVWKGQRYTNLAADDPNYSSPDHQPWEAEAEHMEEKVRELMYERLPVLKNL